MYKDAKTMSGEEKERIFNLFKAVVFNMNVYLIDRPLYYHLTRRCGLYCFPLHCHFSFQDIRDVFYGTNFERFMWFFDRKRKDFAYLWEGITSYEDINKDIFDFGTEEAPRVYKRMIQARKDRDKKLRQEMGWFTWLCGVFG